MTITINTPSDSAYGGTFAVSGTRDANPIEVRCISQDGVPRMRWTRVPEGAAGAWSWNLGGFGDEYYQFQVRDAYAPGTIIRASGWARMGAAFRVTSAALVYVYDPETGVDNPTITAPAGSDVLLDGVFGGYLPFNESTGKGGFGAPRWLFYAARGNKQQVAATTIQGVVADEDAGTITGAAFRIPAKPGTWRMCLTNGARVAHQEMVVVATSIGTAKALSIEPVKQGEIRSTSLPLVLAGYYNGAVLGIEYNPELQPGVWYDATAGLVLDGAGRFTLTIPPPLPFTNDVDGADGEGQTMTIRVKEDPSVTAQWSTLKFTSAA